MTETHNKAGSKEIFFTIAAILGFVVDIIALWKLFPINLNASGQLEITTTTQINTIFSFGSFRMPAKIFTAYLLVFVFITSLLALTIYFKRNQENFLNEHGFEPSFPSGSIILYTQLLNLLIVVWIFTFYPIRDWNVIFLAGFALSQFLLIFLLGKIAILLRSRMKVSNGFTITFLYILLWIIISLFEVGYFGTSVSQSFILPLLAFVAGWVILYVEGIIFHFLFTLLIRSAKPS